MEKGDAGRCQGKEPMKREEHGSRYRSSPCPAKPPTRARTWDRTGHGDPGASVCRAVRDAGVTPGVVR